MSEEEDHDYHDNNNNNDNNNGNNNNDDDNVEANLEDGTKLLESELTLELSSGL